MFHFQKKKHMHYQVKDLPPFYHLYFPELASFKFFFWMKSILHNKGLKNEKFTFNNLLYFKLKDTSTKMIILFNQIPTTEIWNEEGIHVTIRQIELYNDMGLIPSQKELKILFEQLLEVVNHLEKMADLGLKFPLGKEPTSESASYTMYVNDFVIGDNTIIAELDNVQITYLNHSVMYFIGSMDLKFNEAMFYNLHNLIKKSTMISTVGEKERIRFFNKLRRKIEIKLAAIDLKLSFIRITPLMVYGFFRI